MYIEGSNWENKMSIKCMGIARLKIPETGEVFQVYPDDLEWEIVEADERQMGPELYYCAKFSLYSEQEEFEVEVEWNVWEYPIGDINHTDFEVRDCELLENFAQFYSDSLEDDYESLIAEVNADKTENQLKEKEKPPEYLGEENSFDF